MKRKRYYSPEYIKRLRFEIIRERCPVHFGRCAKCPFALVDLARVARLCKVSERSLLSKRELFSLPDVPLSVCSCLLTGLQCVAP